MKTIVLGLLLTLTGTGIYAQQSGRRQMDPEKRAEMQTRRMTEQLGLTSEQQQKVGALNLERAKQMQANREDGNQNRRELMTKYNDDLNQILTPEQKEKYKALREDMRQRGPRGNNEGRRSRNQEKN